MKIFSRPFAFRKWDGERFEKRLNRAVFDVVASSFAQSNIRLAALKKKGEVLNTFKDLCSDPEFRSAIESTTKSRVAVRTRFSKWYKVLGAVIGKRIPLVLPPE